MPTWHPVQWGKLLLNLNNPVNALSGLPLRDELLQRGYRRVLAALQQEALDLLDAAHRPVAQLTPLPPRRLLMLLRHADTPSVPAGGGAHAAHRRQGPVQHG